MTYPRLARNISGYLSDLLTQFPCVAILGARQVGKTTLAKTAMPDWLYLDLERSLDLDRLTHDVAFFFKQHPNHVIFDEAQLYPELFAALRGVIDEDRQQKGRFILTGSSSPELLSNISETLAGRIAIIELGTLKMNEYYQAPLSDFYEIFKNPLNKNQISISPPQFNYEKVQSHWLKGGYPEPRQGDENYYQEWFVDYQATYVNRDIARLFPHLDKLAYRRFTGMLGKLSSHIINKSELARSLSVSQPTVSDYLDIAEGTFLWRKLNSYESNPNKSIVKMPRGHIRDSGLLHHILRLNSLEQLQQDPIAGFSFESFVIEEILKGLQDARCRSVDYYYYRTRSGAEIDLILEGSFGTLPIEIKYGVRVARQQLKALSEFIDNQKLPFGLVINQAEKVEWLTETILQVPVGCL
jgi:predicted AAA+ superfamily ATPase